jgi:hypothetical protein
MKIERLEDITSIPEPREYSPEELKEAYALAKATFTADDLYECIEGILHPEEGEDVQELLAEMEQNQQQADQRTA